MTDAGFPLSVVVIARNEEINIKRCLDAVRWCDERVVVDDGSIDRTREIARFCGARVVSRRFDTFAGQRNWALENAGLTNDFVLMLDADEVVTPQLRRALKRELPFAAPQVVAYRMCRKTMWGDRWLKHADAFPVWIMRLVRRGRVRFVDQGHGEVPVPPVAGRMGSIREPFLHFPFSHGLDDWRRRHIRYAEREAVLELDDRGSRLRDLLNGSVSDRRAAFRDFARKLPGRSHLRFLYHYVLRRGFLDGRAGFDFSRLMAWYEGLIQSRRHAIGGESGKPHSRAVA